MVMSLFIFFAAILILIALGFSIAPLFKTQRKLALLLAIGLPLLTFALYKHVGNPQAFDAAPVSEITKNAPTTDINTAIANLEAELKSKPDNLEGWVLLARTQMAIGNYEAANQAFAKAIMLEPGNPDLKTERAEAMMRASGSRTFSDEAVALLKQALSENPEHERAMFFIGMHYLQQGDSAQAEIYLNKLLPKLDAEAAVALREQINIARAQQNKTPFEATETQSSANSNAPHIKVQVSLDKTVAAAVKPGAVLFVFAKSISGGGPPVAAKRIEVSTFPIELELSDSDSLMPTANLSSQEKVLLSARISLQGVANSQAGDIEAEAVVVETRTKNIVEIKLSRVKQ
jgi:cytochrome c-type biogenesis protein CcmH